MLIQNNLESLYNIPLQQGIYILAITPLPPGKGGKEKNEEKKMDKGRKKGYRSKKEGSYPYFVSLFNISPYKREKSPNNWGRREYFSGWP